MSNKFWIIAQRECFIRMRKPSFWLLALLGPLVLLFMSIVPYAITSGVQEEKQMLLNVPNECFDQFPLTIGAYQTHVISTSTEEAYLAYSSGEEQVFCDLHVSPDDTSWHVYSKNKLPVLDSLNMLRVLANVRLDLHHQPVMTTFVSLDSIPEERISSLQQTIALVASLLVYFFLFTYSASLLKGVMEEKSNKVMDIILSSVSPFHWLMGKIGGVGLASLAQFGLWMLVSYLPYYFFEQHYGDAMHLFSAEQIHATVQQSADPGQALAWNQWIEGLQAIAWVSLFLVMICCMVFGFVLYASVFAMVGILSDREADTQPYILPITSPLLLSFFTSGLVMADPYGDAAAWLSFIPFTAPVIIPLRLALGVAWQDLLFSQLILALGSLVLLFFAGKLYKRVLNKGGRVF